MPDAPAAEELVAEIGSMMLTAYPGVAGEHVDTHAACIRSCLRAPHTSRPCP